jgi:hypothetical protein
MRNVLALIGLIFSVNAFAFTCPTGGYLCVRNSTSGLEQTAVCFEVTPKGIYAEADRFQMPVEFSFEDAPHWRRCIGVFLGDCTHETYELTSKGINAYLYLTNSKKVAEHFLEFDFATGKAQWTVNLLRQDGAYTNEKLVYRYLCRKLENGEEVVQDTDAVRQFWEKFNKNKDCAAKLE